MSQSPITPDDPRLTAYVLGELEAADRAAVEAQMASDPQCREIVEHLQQTTATLFEALQSEPVPSLTDRQRAAIRSAASQPVSVVVAPPTESSPRRGGVVGGDQRRGGLSGRHGDSLIAAFLRRRIRVGRSERSGGHGARPAGD